MFCYIYIYIIYDICYIFDIRIIYNKAKKNAKNVLRK